MPTAGRPRKIGNEYERLVKGFGADPRTLVQTKRMLNGVWSRYLQRVRTDTDDVTVDTFRGFLQALRKEGWTHYRMEVFQKIKEAYVKMGMQQPGTKWSQLAKDVDSILLPDPTGQKEPFEPFPLKLGPKILEASRHVEQFRVGSGEPVYSEASTLVATLLYSGGRAHWYGLEDAQVEKALDSDTKYVELYVKGGHLVKVPIHDRLLAIWKEHLDKRDFDGPFFFRRGKDAWAHKRGSVDFDRIELNAHNNNVSVQEILQWQHRRDRDRNADCVRRRLFEMFGVDEDLTAHRFRAHVGTWFSAYGLTEPERRLVLSHGAKTITSKYDRRDIEEVQRKMSLIDLGSEAWVSAHDPPKDLFDENARMVVELQQQLLRERDRNDRLERKIDELLARGEPRVVA